MKLRRRLYESRSSFAETALDGFMRFNELPPLGHRERGRSLASRVARATRRAFAQRRRCTARTPCIYARLDKYTIIICSICRMRAAGYIIARVSRDEQQQQVRYETLQRIISQRDYDDVIEGDSNFPAALALVTRSVLIARDSPPTLAFHRRT